MNLVRINFEDEIVSKLITSQAGLTCQNNKILRDLIELDFIIVISSKFVCQFNPQFAASL